ncbi:hypothetical protein HG536_0D05020 [Torulaspora globosa]|uniref:Sec20 C-terminal domain-containing protein n=1 Tax=Torulaspora globosa TaxID=48254 RepID=A0A7G3ZHJ4_9SACH|nr:uncharacterized protein HG536_0D05020 [Torulaspora globosa]QLL32980.1 hypothetical protein HG536_0D05020 [Torulaspora globosa]
MMESYKARLETLRNSMLSELQKVNNGQLRSQTEGYSAKEAADMMLEYESLIRTVQVCLNNSHRGLRVTWRRGTATDSYDSLEMEHNGEIEKSTKSKMVEDLEFLLRCIDWLFEYRQNYSVALKEAHAALTEQDHAKRGESIEANAVHFDKSASSSSENEVPLDSHRGATTKDRLLNKTKQVSANLIRGNQVLQSAVLQSDLNLDELREQTNSLTQVNDKYIQLETVFVKTAQLVKVLDKASHQEKRDVYLALAFASLCVAWVLWRRIFKIPVKLFFWLAFRFFKGILVTFGLVRKLPIKPHKVTTPPVAFLGTAASTTSTTIESIEQAVDEAISRILTHDEL